MTRQKPSTNGVGGSAVTTTDGAGHRERTDPPEVAPADLLELLSDEYTRRVLRAVMIRAMSARDVMAHADVSKVTAYRRLDCLEEAGLVESTTVIDPDGHHHARYRAVVDGVTLRFDEDGLDSAIRSHEAAESDDS